VRDPEAAVRQRDGEGSGASAHVQDGLHAVEPPFELAPPQGAVNGLVAGVDLFLAGFGVPPASFAVEIDRHRPCPPVRD